MRFVLLAETEETRPWRRLCGVRARWTQTANGRSGAGQDHRGGTELRTFTRDAEAEAADQRLLRQALLKKWNGKLTHLDERNLKKQLSL
jgi:hypothetical protein